MFYDKSLPKEGKRRLSQFSWWERDFATNHCFLSMNKGKVITLLNWAKILKISINHENLVFDIGLQIQGRLNQISQPSLLVIYS